MKVWVAVWPNGMYAWPDGFDAYIATTEEMAWAKASQRYRHANCMKEFLTKEQLQERGWRIAQFIEIGDSHVASSVAEFTEVGK